MKCSQKGQLLRREKISSTLCGHVWAAGSRDGRMEKDLYKRMDAPNTAQHPSPVLRADHSGRAEGPRHEALSEEPSSGVPVGGGGGSSGVREPQLREPGGMMGEEGNKQQSERLGVTPITPVLAFRAHSRWHCCPHYYDEDTAVSTTGVEKGPSLGSERREFPYPL